MDGGVLVCNQFFERRRLHVDTFTVSDGTLYGKIILGDTANWHKSVDESSDHPVSLNHSSLFFGFYAQLIQLGTQPAMTPVGAMG